MSDVVPLLRANISLNSVVSTNTCLKCCLAQKYLAVEHMWGTNTQSLLQLLLEVEASTGDPSHSTNSSLLVLGSDVVYDPLGYEPLVSSVLSLLSGRPFECKDGKYLASTDIADHHWFSQAMFLLAHRHRHPEDHE